MIEATSPLNVGEPCGGKAEEEVGRSVRKGGLVTVPKLFLQDDLSF